MPQALALIAVVQTVAEASAVGALTAVGLSGAAALSVVGAAEGGLLLAGVSAISSALQPGVPPPAAVSTPLKQTRPDRQSGYGAARLSGAYMLYDTAPSDGTSTDVLALHDGLIDGFEVFYLNDDKVTVRGDGWVTAQTNADGRYSAYDKVQLLATLGHPTEAAYTAIAGAVMPNWGADHRGDGVASLYLGCRTPLLKYYDTIYPNGLPQASAVARLLPVRDVRTDAVAWSANPVNALADYLTHPVHGMGLDWSRRIAPAAALWQSAANDCAYETDGKPRYACGGVFKHSTAPSDVIAALLASFDGWMGQTASGALNLYSGRYYAPTVTFDDDVITSYSVQHGVEVESVVNAIGFSYTSPLHDYTSQPGDEWIDEDDVAARGYHPTTVDLTWVQDHSQGRRLCKRRASRNLAPTRGTVTTNLGGMVGLGERFVQLQIAELAFEAPVEISAVEIDLASLSLTFTWVQADPNIDEWDEAIEAGNAPPVGDASAAEPLPLAVITGVAIDYQQVAGGVGGLRALVSVAPVGFAETAFLLRWRKPDGFWDEKPFTEADGTATVVLATDFLPAGSDLTIEVAYAAAGRHSGWSLPSTLVADPSSHPALPAPTGVTAAGGAYDGTVSFDPVAGADGYIVAYSTSSTFDPASQGSGIEAYSVPAYLHGLAAGTYYAKVAAFDAWRQDTELLNFSGAAAFTIATGGGATPPGGGGGAGGGGYRCLAPETLVLMADGSLKSAGELKAGDRIWTRDALRGVWGAFVVFSAKTFQGQERHAWRGLLAAPRHRVALGASADFTRIDALGSTPAEPGPVVSIQTRDAHTVTVFLPDDGEDRSDIAAAGFVPPPGVDLPPGVVLLTHNLKSLAPAE